MSSHAELSTALSEAVAKVHRDQHGRAPGAIESTYLPEMAIAMVSDVFTATEKELCETEEGRKAVQSARRELRALTRRDIEKRIALVVGRPIIRSYYDLDVRIGQQIEVFVFGS